MQSAQPVTKDQPALSEEDIRFYNSEGYLVIRNVFETEQIENLAADIERLLLERHETIQPKNLRVRFKNHVVTGEPVFEVLDPVSDLSALARQMTVDRRLIDFVSSIYGEPACVFKDKFIYKPAGSLGADLHQDWIGWPGFPQTFLTALVAIDTFNERSGATKVYPRLQSKGYLSPIDGKHHHLQHEDMATEAVCLELEPGDVALFSCFTPHYSEPNLSPSARRGYFISYNARSDGGDQWEKHYREFHEWIRARLPEDKRDEFVFV
jgi:ectoine hydroxylase-related dioxygenase (phytanoyl-CoA dioxygenase family)